MTMLFPIPERFIDRRPYLNMPPGPGFLFTLAFSRWLQNHMPLQFRPDGDTLFVELSDPVTILSFQSL